MFTLGVYTWKYSNNLESGYALVPTSTNREIQQFFMQIAGQLKNIDINVNNDLANRLQGCLKERFHRMQKQQLRLLNTYLNEIEPLVKLLAADQSKHSSLYPTVKKRITSVLNERTNEFIENLKELKMKARLINDLKRQHFEYYSVLDDFHRISNEQMLESRLIKDHPRCRILCSNDFLNHNHPDKFNQLRQQLSAERGRLVYADFSYCSFPLTEMKVLPRNASPLTTFMPIPSTDEDDVINILLLGETGVGKSTFINAFVNYLTFDTFEQAEMNQPIALIPVSFLLTIGQNFDEHLIEFGDAKQLTNEDFTHPGQSVTQHCKSHRFDLRRDIGKKVCIIDTPGFGDTRGLEQDDLNMQHILQYLRKLSHLNAVCFLLKPNVTRLNVSFRTCLMQLFEQFGANFSHNFIFGFTNARSTSYTPGDTAPLLRTMFESLPVKKISLRKENTFCFDSESFRYLVALQNGIQFDHLDKKDYEISWKTSVVESNRLLNYVRTQLKAYPLHHHHHQAEQPSEKHLQIEIVQMIRPMLETMRNLLRNLLLTKINSSKSFIKLCPRPLSRPMAFCTTCKRDPFLLGHCWLLPDDLHEIGNQCRTCQCHIDQHMTIDYIVSYDISNDSSLFNPNEMKKILNQLCLASAEFACFLINGIHSTNEDPFLLGLLHMIEEEQLICTEVQEFKELNQQLYKQLNTLKQEYEKHIQNIQLHSKHADLQSIYQQIQIIHQIPVIHEQMLVIKTRQETQMQQNEAETLTSKNST